MSEKKTPALSQEQVLAQMKKDIEKFGWSIISSTHNDINFTHTVGLKEKYQHPDLEIVGVDLNIANQILNELAHRVKEGEVYDKGDKITDMIEGYTLWLVRNPKDPEGDDLIKKRLRVIWPDSEKRYPWDKKCEPDCAKQQVIHATQLK